MGVKLPVVNWADLDQLIKQAWIFESKLLKLAKKPKLTSNNVTKGLLPYKPQQTYMLGIHGEAEGSKEILAVEEAAKGTRTEQSVHL